MKSKKTMNKKILSVFASYMIVFAVVILMAKLIVYFDTSKKLYQLDNIVIKNNTIDKHIQSIGNYGAYYIFNEKNSLTLKICDGFDKNKTYKLDFVLSDNPIYAYKPCQFSIVNGQYHYPNNKGLYSIILTPSNISSCLETVIEVSNSQYKCHKWLGYISVKEKK